jgi:spermidine synthase
LLVRAMVSNPRTACRTIGYLYGVNTLGAAVGALVTPWLLMRVLGVRGAIHAGLCFNVLAGLGALAVGRLAGPAETADTPDPTTPAHGAAEAPASRPFRLWVLLYAMGGFCALGLEIAWFRLIDVCVKSTAFTFGTVLAIYLGGLAVGSLAGGPLVVRLRHPLRAYLVCQCWVLGLSGLAILVLANLPADLPGYQWFMTYWRQYEGILLGHHWDWHALTMLYALLPVWLYAAPTVLMGVAFAILQRAVHDDRRTSGRKVGLLQAANIAGCVVGSLVVGLLLLSWIGTAGTLRILVGLGLVFAIVGLGAYGMRSRFTPIAIALVAIVVLLPSQHGLWSRLHGRAASEEAYFDEDATGLMAITKEAEHYYRVSVNGKGHSALPFAGIHSQLGAVPAILHPAPKDVAVIGLGSGDTAWAAGCRTETQRLTCFEICSPQERLLERFIKQHDMPRLRRFLQDPRLRIVVADGRNALASHSQRYDLIEADALRPYSAYAGNLYSLEFFKLCASKLKPGGVMCTWCPRPRVYRTFCLAFEHVVDFGDGTILVGGNEPIQIDKKAWEKRLASQTVQDYLTESVAKDVLARLDTGKPADPRGVESLNPNRDLFPRDELLSPH